MDRIIIHNTLSHFSVELAVIMNKYYSGVCYAGIDVDPELKYPKGAGRVAFSNHTSYINAINNRFIQLKIGDIDKKVFYTLLSFILSPLLGFIFYTYCTRDDKQLSEV